MPNAPVVFHILGRLCCDGVTKQLRDHMQRGIDAGRDARRGDDVAVVDEAGPAKNVRRGTRLRQLVERNVMSGRIETVEQARAAEKQCTSANREYRFRICRLATNPFEQCRVVHLAARAEAAGKDQHVATRRLVDRHARSNLEAVPSSYRRFGESDRFYTERRGSGPKAGDTEHLEWAR